MTPEEQVNLWVDGKSVHSKERDECTPDFSCCTPSLLAPPEVRLMFKRSNQKMRDRLCMEFLAKMLAVKLPNTGVYIAGLEESRREAENGKVE